MSEELVLTPGGFRPKSLVNAVEPGHGLNLLVDTGELAKVELATNKVIQTFAKPPGLQAQFAAHGPGGGPKGHLAPPPAALPNGWQTYGWWDSGAKSITYFSTAWIVPPAPSTSSGQIVFLFNGIQNTGANFGILQPVLQWGTSAMLGPPGSRRHRDGGHRASHRIHASGLEVDARQRGHQLRPAHHGSQQCESERQG
jgi:hypothetical protein